MRPKGFVLLYAVMTASIVLAVGVSIISIALKQLSIANLGRESQYAFYAANTGAECALYWDFHGVLGSAGPGGTYRRLAVFRSPFSGTWPEVTDANAVVCARTKLMANQSPYDPDTLVGGVTGVNDTWSEASCGSACNATAFTVFLGRRDGEIDYAGPCARVTVEKVRGSTGAGGAFVPGAADSDQNLETTIDSRGYNYCSEDNSRRVERGLRFTY